MEPLTTAAKLNILVKSGILEYASVIHDLTMNSFNPPDTGSYFDSETFLSN